MNTYYLTRILIHVSQNVKITERNTNENARIIETAQEKQMLCIKEWQQT